MYFLLLLLNLPPNIFDVPTANTLEKTVQHCIFSHTIQTIIIFHSLSSLSFLQTEILAYLVLFYMEAV